MGAEPEEWGRKTKRQEVHFYEGDIKLLEFIQEYLGCSRSEAIRSAVRAFATHLAHLDGSRAK